MREVDSYRQLAAYIVTTEPAPVVRQIIQGELKPVLEMLKDECRLLDWNGPIIDTLFADLHSVQDSMWLRQQIEGFANILIQRLDFPRLISEITYLCPNL